MAAIRTEKFALKFMKRPRFGKRSYSFFGVSNSKKGPLSRKRALLQKILATMARDLGWRLAQVWGRSRSRSKSRSRSRNRRLPQGDTSAFKEARVLGLLALKTGMRGQGALGRVGWA